jgi:hypothetical protein
MKPRRWFVTPELTQWKYMTACGDYAGPFFSFHQPSELNVENLSHGLMLAGTLDTLTAVRGGWEIWIAAGQMDAFRIAMGRSVSQKFRHVWADSLSIIGLRIMESPYFPDNQGAFVEMEVGPLPTVKTVYWLDWSDGTVKIKS